MTSTGLVTAPVGTSLDEAKAILQRHRIEKLPLVDGAGRLAGLITVKDIQKRQEFPNASRDDAGRLRCAAAVGVGDDLEARVEALVDRGIDAVAIDTAHGHSAGVIKAIERIKGGWPDLAVVAGNVVTEEGVDALADAGADAVKVGVGAGSICTTRVISGAGMPQLSAIWTASRRARQRGVPVIADGGVTYSGDIVKAIAAGAETVMLGSLLAGTEESPGEMELFEGRRYKSYRGHGVDGGDAGARRRPLRQRSGRPAGRRRRQSNKLVPEGIEGRVPYAGPLGDVVYQLVGGLRSGMGYAGTPTLDALRTRARFMRVTTAGREESHPHDVTITNEAPNYQRGLTSRVDGAVESDGPTRPRRRQRRMFKRILPTSPSPSPSSGVVTVAGLAGAGSAGACPPPDPSTTEPPTRRRTPSRPPTSDGRCAIDAEAYFRDYQAGRPGHGDDGDADPPASPPGDLRRGGRGVEPIPPIVIDEPGVLDDNTFVDAGDSLWVATEDDRESTFALDVDTGSFNVAQTFLANGYRPEPDSIRAEEWVNAFAYGDAPATDADLAITVESASTDGRRRHGPRPHRRDVPPARRRGAPAGEHHVRHRHVRLDGHPRTPRPRAVVAGPARAQPAPRRHDRHRHLRRRRAPAARRRRRSPSGRASSTPSTPCGPSGSTNMEAGLLLGYEAARENYDPDALNVVVLASDGVANQGVTDPEVLTDEITQAGEEGIHLVTVGYGMGNYNDHLMEQLADLGDGFYSYVDTFDEAVDLFVDNLTPTLTVVAEEAKIQVVFDERRRRPLPADRLREPGARRRAVHATTPSTPASSAPGTRPARSTRSSWLPGAVRRRRRRRGAPALAVDRDRRGRSRWASR